MEKAMKEVRRRACRIVSLKTRTSEEIDLHVCRTENSARVSISALTNDLTGAPTETLCGTEP